MDLPAEIRCQVYDELIQGLYSRYGPVPESKRPGALIDRWKHVTNPGFYQDELFRSPSAVIAANHQIHDEFYGKLQEHILCNGGYVMIHILDFDFQPLMTWLSRSSTPDQTLTHLSRVQNGGKSRTVLGLDLDFELFTPLSATSLSTWLSFAATHGLKVTTNRMEPEIPKLTRMHWIGHGFAYPIWAKKYYDYAAPIIDRNPTMTNFTTTPYLQYLRGLNPPLWRKIQGTMRLAVHMFQNVDPVWELERRTQVKGAPLYEIKSGRVIRLKRDHTHRSHIAKNDEYNSDVNMLSDEDSADNENYDIKAR